MRKTWVPILLTLSNTVLEGLTRTIKKCKERKGVRIKRKETKILLFLHKMIVPRNSEITYL